MLKIERVSNKLLVRVSEPGMGVRGYSVKAADATEAAEAVKHYYGSTRQCAGLPTCPLCRLMEEERSKAKKRKRA